MSELVVIKTWAVAATVVSVSVSAVFPGDKPRGVGTVVMASGCPKLLP